MPGNVLMHTFGMTGSSTCGCLWVCSSLRVGALVRGHAATADGEVSETGASWVRWLQTAFFRSDPSSSPGSHPHLLPAYAYAIFKYL